MSTFLPHVPRDLQWFLEIPHARIFNQHGFLIALLHPPSRSRYAVRNTTTQGGHKEIRMRYYHTGVTSKSESQRKCMVLESKCCTGELSVENTYVGIRTQCYNTVKLSKMLYTSTIDGFWTNTLHALCMTWHYCSYATTIVQQQVLCSQYYHTEDLYYVSRTIDMCNFSIGKILLRTCTTERPTLLAASSLHRQGPQSTIAGVNSSEECMEEPGVRRRIRNLASTYVLPRQPCFRMLMCKRMVW